MIILDTNVISELLKPHPDKSVLSWISGVDGYISTTAVTAAELLAGVEVMPDSQRRTKLKQHISAILDQYRSADMVFPFDRDAASQFATVISSRRSAGRPIATEDAQIAAISLAQKAGLATRNTKDFEGLGLELINPWNH